MSKRERAQIIYNDLASRGHNDRKMIIQRFQDVLEMTPAGAATYYAACKKQFNINNGIEQAPVKRKSGSTKIEVTRERSDSRQLYTVCTADEDGKSVDSTHSFYNIDDAKTNCTADQVVVKGVPELNSDWSSLKPIK